MNKIDQETLRNLNELLKYENLENIIGDYKENEILVKKGYHFFSIEQLKECFGEKDDNIKSLIFICDKVLNLNVNDFNDLITDYFPNLEIFVFKHDYIDCSWDFNKFPKSIKKFYFMSYQTRLYYDLNFTDTNLEKCIMKIHKPDIKFQIINKKTEVLIYSDRLIYSCNKDILI